MTKHFINERQNIVTEAIDAEIALSNGALRRLDGYPAIKVVVRADWERNRSTTKHVAIISGGGAGHEPAHVGFVGDGMLTAAVSGEIFASPSVDAVLAGILAVTGSSGCLLIVKNYTGDRLNFGLAAERARALGMSVEMVIVGDDIALPEAHHPRGVAGTLFVHKVAGHVARAGGSLADVKAAAEHVAKATASIGASLSSCTIPGHASTESRNRIGEEEVELGLGIHGEPGASIVPWQQARQLGATMIERIEKALTDRGIDPSLPVALLINDLGGVPPIELNICARAAFESSKREVKLVFGPDRFMTSLDMKGFSISMLPLRKPEIEAALISPVGPCAWPIGRRPTAYDPLPLAEALRPKEITPSAHPVRRSVLERICDALIAKQSDLDALDAKVGDGDTGTTFATAARAIKRDLDLLPLAEPKALCSALSDRIARVMGGSSGILLAIFLAAMASRDSWLIALEEGVRRVQEYGGAKPGDRTMLDALVPAINALEEAEGDLRRAAVAARDGAQRTASMTRARAGRSSYVREDVLREIPDPGAVAIAVIFEALAT